MQHAAALSARDKTIALLEREKKDLDKSVREAAAQQRAAAEKAASDDKQVYMQLYCSHIAYS
jgi:hypothetical protein